MNQIALLKQMYIFNKAAFEKTISFFTILQEQNEETVVRLIKQNDLLSEQKKKAIIEWVDMCKTNRKELMTKCDRSFKGIEKVFAEYE